METVSLLRSELQGFRVTAIDRDPQRRGLRIDATLLSLVGILPLQTVEVINLDTGDRWSTVVLPAEADSGQLSLAGGSGLRAAVGDRLIVQAYVNRVLASVHRIGHQATVALATEENQVEQIYSERLDVSDLGLSFGTDDPRDGSSSVH